VAAGNRRSTVSGRSVHQSPRRRVERTSGATLRQPIHTQTAPLAARPCRRSRAILAPSTVALMVGAGVRTSWTSSEPLPDRSEFCPAEFGGGGRPSSLSRRTTADRSTRRYQTAAHQATTTPQPVRHTSMNVTRSTNDRPTRSVPKTITFCTPPDRTASRSAVSPGRRSFRTVAGRSVHLTTAHPRSQEPPEDACPGRRPKQDNQAVIRNAFSALNALIRTTSRAPFPDRSASRAFSIQLGGTGGWPNRMQPISCPQLSNNGALSRVRQVCLHQRVGRRR
jgi:hypothetical protein